LPFLRICVHLVDTPAGTVVTAVGFAHRLVDNHQEIEDIDDVVDLAYFIANATAVRWCSDGYISPQLLTVCRVNDIQDEVNLLQDIKNVYLTVTALWLTQTVGRIDVTALVEAEITRLWTHTERITEPISHPVIGGGNLNALSSRGTGCNLIVYGEYDSIAFLDDTSGIHAGKHHQTAPVKLLLS
jgi:hypothetical protein